MAAELIRSYLESVESVLCYITSLLESFFIYAGTYFIGITAVYAGGGCAVG